MSGDATGPQRAQGLALGVGAHLADRTDWQSALDAVTEWLDDHPMKPSRAGLLAMVTWQALQIRRLEREAAGPAAGLALQQIERVVRDYREATS